MTSTSPAVVVVGSASWNRIVRVGELPEPRPHTVTAIESWTTLGGTSAGKSLHLARQGIETLCVAMIGDDAAAERIAAGLRREHLDAVLIAAPAPSEQHLNLVTPAGERLSIFLHHAPEPALDAHRERLLAAVGEARVVVADLMPIARSVLADLRAVGAWIWTDLHDYDGVDRYHEEFVGAADVVLMNDDGAERVEPVMQGIIERGASAVVCTRGPLGAVGIIAGGERVTVEACPTRVVDSNGAGDAFMAGMLHWVLGHRVTRGGLGGRELREAMLAGATSAVTALETRGIAPGQSIFAD